MKVKQLNNKEKGMAIAIIIILLLGGYGYLRFQPKMSEVDSIERQKQATLNRISTMEIPDEPQEKIDEIIAALDDQEKAQEAIEDNAARIEMQLAPVDSQELRVRISELARDSGIRIRVNETLRPAPISNASAGNRRTKAADTDKEINVPVEAGWVTRLAPGSMFHRPLQRLEIDGDYPSLRRFIHGLDDLPYQVTVVRMNIEKLDISPLRGMSQLLKTELVLAL